jgi:hypothetical protein
MEAARSSETLVTFYQTTQRYNPEDSHLRTHRCENLKSYYKNLTLYTTSVHDTTLIKSIKINYYCTWQSEMQGLSWWSVKWSTWSAWWDSYIAESKASRQHQLWGLDRVPGCSHSWGPSRSGWLDAQHHAPCFSETLVLEIIIHEEWNCELWGWELTTNAIKTILHYSSPYHKHSQTSNSTLSTLNGIMYLLTHNSLCKNTKNKTLSANKCSWTDNL